MMFGATNPGFSEINETEDSLLRFAVIASCYEGQWIYCRHKERSTWEMPGGRREPGETILETARRELYEETGALDFELQPVCVYYVERDGDQSYGLLCHAKVKTLGELPASEIERIRLFDDQPDALTYPLIQPYLMGKVKSWLDKEAEND